MKEQMRLHLTIIDDIVLIAGADPPNVTVGVPVQVEVLVAGVVNGPNPNKTEKEEGIVTVGA